MSRVTSDTMTVSFNGSDYSNYIDEVSVSGGGPIYEYVKKWNGRKSRGVTGYNEWNVTVSMLADTATGSFIPNLTDSALTYTIAIGSAGVIENTYSNMYVDTFSDKLAAEDGMEMYSITFIGEGLPSNKS